MPQAAAGKAPERPDSRTQAFQRKAGESALPGAWGPPALSWLLLGVQGCSWIAPGLSWPAWATSTRPTLDNATFSVKLARVTIPWVMGSLGLSVLLPAASSSSWMASGCPGLKLHRLGTTAAGSTPNDPQQRDFNPSVRRRNNSLGHRTGSQARGTCQRIQKQRLEPSALVGFPARPRKPPKNNPEIYQK